MFHKELIWKILKHRRGGKERQSEEEKERDVRQMWTFDTENFHNERIFFAF